MLDSAVVNSLQVQTQVVEPIIRFGVYQADLRNCELRKSGIRLRLQGQPFQVLSLLLRRSGEVVTREEFRKAVWPMDTFVDFDHALNTAVKKIRGVLGDDADNPRFVETVPRRGYRFVAPVHLNGTVAPFPVSVTPAKHDIRRWVAVIAIVAITVGGLAFLWTAPWRHGEPTSSPEFQRLTFDLSDLGDARFTPDGASVMYSSGGHAAHRTEVYSQLLGSSTTQPVGTSNSTLLGVSRQGELALLDERQPAGIAYRKPAGVLGRAFPGGAARALLPDVEAADWSPSGQLAVVRRVGRKSRLEFPVGNTLYETIGWIASPRFSPRGDSIAFLDHPTAPDDRGSVMLVSLNGQKKTLSDFWESERGLAWSPRGDEVWFAAASSGVSRALYAVDMNRRVRRVLSVAGGLSLQDISSDGRVLLTRDNERLGILFAGPNDKEPRDLSWKDWSLVTDISQDGKKILFGEEGEDSGASYQVGVRPVDGSPPVILGSGSAQSFSPDGKWVLSIMPPPDDQLVLLPIEAGSAKPLARGPIERYQFAGATWTPDARQVVFVGFEPGRGPRCYAQSVDGGAPQPFTPEGAVLCSVAPDGRVLALIEDYRGRLYRSTDSQTPDAEFQFKPGDWPRAWSRDGKSVFLVEAEKQSVAIVRFDLSTGRRQLWKELPSAPQNTEMRCEEVVLTPDGQSFAFTYSHHFSDLYLVSGLK